MADRTFTLDWRVRTRKHEILTRAKLGTLDAQLSFRRRARGPLTIDPSIVVPSAPASRPAIEDEPTEPSTLFVNSPHAGV